MRKDRRKPPHIYRRYYTFLKQKAKNCSPFRHGEDQKWRCQVELSPTLQGLRGKTSCIKVLTTIPRLAMKPSFRKRNCKNRWLQR
ncbi:hypothetical protein TNCV_351571 [Trichonephila clavipes]|nr:hypothetical protein TNCV_351571 [Trichonephila clavipes]